MEGDEDFLKKMAGAELCWYEGGHEAHWGSPRLTGAPEVNSQEMTLPVSDSAPRVPPPLPLAAAPLAKWAKR